MVTNLKANRHQVQVKVLAVVVANPVDFDVVAWLEDELLLKLPLSPCQDASCSNRPATSYEPGIQSWNESEKEIRQEAGKEVGKEADNKGYTSGSDAFAVLATLKLGEGAPGKKSDEKSE